MSESNAPWHLASLSPMRKQWQALLYNPNGAARDYYFSMRKYLTLRAIIRRVELEARWCFAERFAIRGEHGNEVFDGATENALKEIA